MYQLINGESEHKKHPDTYEIPRRSVRYSLHPGDLVKLGFDQWGRPVERMWVRVMSVLPDKEYAGALVTHPIVVTELQPGDVVTFSPKNVIGYHYRARGCFGLFSRRKPHWK